MTMFKKAGLFFITLILAIKSVAGSGQDNTKIPCVMFIDGETKYICRMVSTQTKCYQISKEIGASSYLFFADERINTCAKAEDALPSEIEHAQKNMYSRWELPGPTGWWEETPEELMSRWINPYED